jgi:hypothetical protein
MTNVAFDIGDIVYLKASAQRGFLESYQISSVRTEGSVFIYYIKVVPTPQRSIASGNYLNHIDDKEIGFYEDQLISSKSEVVNLAIQYHESQIEYLNTLLD